MTVNDHHATSLHPDGQLLSATKCDVGVGVELYADRAQVVLAILLGRAVLGGSLTPEQAGVPARQATGAMPFLANADAVTMP